MFSKACEYGIKAAIYIAVNSAENKRVSPKEISENIDSPQAFTAKILQALVRHNIITSVRGAYGGFEIDKTKIETTKLSQIVYAIDGDSIYNGSRDNAVGTVTVLSAAQNLARKANISRATTYRYYSQCQQICLKWCIDKKVENTIDL